MSMGKSKSLSIMKLLKSAVKLYHDQTIQERIFQLSQNKEVAVAYTFGFGKRPMILQHPSDVLFHSKKGALSFHVSEEIWENPILLEDVKKQSDMDEIRFGWDLILDIDAKDYEISKIAANTVIEYLVSKGVPSKIISVKFSGNKGFHIAIPYQALPKAVEVATDDGLEKKPIKKFFPEGPKIIAQYIASNIKDRLRKRLLDKFDIEYFINNFNMSFAQLVDKQIVSDEHSFVFNPFSVVEIDTLLISPRHLFRSIFSLNEKSGYVSVPLKLSQISGFDREWTVERVLDNLENLVKIDFLSRSVTPSRALAKLVQSAFNQYTLEEIRSQEKERFKHIVKRRLIKDNLYSTKQNYELKEKITNFETFPPCINRILQGLEDGRKRGLFVLMKFLQNLNWSYDEIEKLVLDWNQRNSEPLKESYVTGQLSYLKRNFSKKILPPNCDKEEYYKEINICIPDEICKKVKNPLNYVKYKVKVLKLNRAINNHHDNQRRNKSSSIS